MINESKNTHKDDIYILNSVQNALKILKLFSIQDSELTLMEICNMTGFNKSTALRLVTTLKSENFLKVNPKTKKYSLGIVLFQLGNYVYESMNLKKISKQYLSIAANELGFIVDLGILENNEVVIIEKVWPDKAAGSIRMVSTVGGIIPIYCTAIGKLFLADKTDEEVRDILKGQQLIKYTTNTITDIDQIIDDLKDIRQKRCAINDCEHEPYLSSIAYPVYDNTNRVIAGISVTNLKEVYNDIDKNLLRTVIKDTARSISMELGMDYAFYK